MKTRYVWIFDPGHGGVIDGVPQTAGKRSPDWDKGVLYEGVMNRIIANKTKKLCDDAGYCVINSVSGHKDVSLSSRVKLENRLYEIHKKKTIFLSFHCDAFHKESASGWSAFTYFGQSDSDKVADVLYKHAKKSKFKIRVDETDGDLDKEENFYILRKTLGPAVLIENFFMTNKKDYDFLMSEKGQNKIANTIFNAIKEIEENGI